MRAFISYADDNQESTNFARWLHSALSRPGSPVTPWLASLDLVPINTFEKRLARAVESCQILLFVRAEYTPDSNACMDELQYARDFGKPILTLRIGNGFKHHPLVDRLPSVDFTGNHEERLKELFQRIESLHRPEGKIAQLQEKLRMKRDSFRRLPPPELAIAKEEAAALEARLKELYAEAQVAADAPVAAPKALVLSRGGVAVADQAGASDVLEEVRGDRVPIILVVGPEGVGKTRLVKGVLEQASQGHQVHSVYRQAFGPHSFTAHDLAELLESAIEAPRASAKSQLDRADISTSRKLELLLELIQDKQLIVVLDSYEVLLDPNTGKLIDVDLDDALEAISRQRRMAVKILIVTREQPFAHPRRWLTRTFMLRFDKGLTPEDFKKLLASFDPHNAYGLLDPPDDAVDSLYQRTGGRPRAAEVVHGILARTPESEHSSLNTLTDVVDELIKVAPDDALDFLTGHLIDSLTHEARRVLQAVSAFGTPVDAEAVAFMLPSEGAKQVEQNLKHLQARHLVRRTANKLYYVQPPDDARALDSVQPVDDEEWDRHHLVLRAASYFALRRRRENEVSGLGDLTAEFNEIDLLLQAEEFDAAFRAVENVDDHLDNWGCSWVLRRQREQLSGVLRDDLSEIVNLQALSEIALRGDDLAAAEAFCRQAISYLDVNDLPDVRKKLYVSLGAVLQRRDEMAKAEFFYREALKIAREHRRPEAEIIPLADLAECLRDRGRLSEAVDCLEQAVDRARAELERESTRDVRRQLAKVMLKLGTRYAELGNYDRAKTTLGEAGAHATEIDSWETRCRHLVAVANLELWQGRIQQARTHAQNGLEPALLLGQLPLQREMYTILAICSLAGNEMPDAVDHVYQATRGRLPGRALITLALNGVLEYRQGALWTAQRFFRRLRLEAAVRSRKDNRDFGAIDMEGFARCGEHLVRNEPPTDAAIAVFRQARHVTSAPGITQQIVQLLTLFNDARLQPAIMAAAGR
ncbi:TIR domain-containing protein [Amycolatopsis sp. cmx-4-68]|uniref:TIR domain-containing protein n=1 Tax=Amycolatopsis sp. cmx-4-68 TaxID=2790938 RepID=UPI00397CD6BA